MRHLDLPLIVIDGEVRLPESGHETTRAVDNGRRDVDELDTCPEAEALLTIEPDCSEKGKEREASPCNACALVNDWGSHNPAARLTQ
jgi:hypothetical protein